MKYELGRRIAAARKERNITQDQLAKSVNVSRQSVSHWEKGVAPPPFEVLCKLIPLLEMDISDLLGLPQQTD